MKRSMMFVVVVGLLGFLSAGCSTPMAMYASAPAGGGSGSDWTHSGRGALLKRMVVWHGSIDVEVENLKKSCAAVAQVVKDNGGYIESKSENAGRSTTLCVRIPSANFDKALSEIGSSGTVNSKYIDSRDITERYADVNARLKNKKALRDRLKQLLDKAESVKDIMTIEKELSRIQADIDSMEAQIKSMKGLADMATLNVTLRQKHEKILGPLGYLFKGLFWGVEKLFIIQK